MIRRISILILFVAFAASLEAQVPSTLIVTAPKSGFIFGEPIKVTARVRDAAGVEIQNAAVSWFVDPPSAATIAGDGTITPLQLQTIVVRGQFGGVQGEIALQVLPKRIIVNPQRMVMTVGSNQVLRAEALDVNDRPIPNIVIRWELRNLARGWDNNNPMASVTAAGLMTSFVQGSILIAAVVDYSSFPGLVNQSRGETTVEMRAVRTYDFGRIFAAEGNSGFSQLKPRTAQLLPTEDDGFIFAASLDSTGVALLKWQNGVLQPLLASGRGHIQTGQPLMDFSAYAGNHRGEMLSEEVDNNGQTQISSGPAAFQSPLLVPGTPLYIADRTNRFDIQRNSLSDTGYKLLLVNYTEVDTLRAAIGLFRGEGSGLTEKILSTLDSLPGYPGATISIRNYGITSDGTAWFVTSIGPGTLRYALWKQTPFGPIERVLGDSDAFQGSTIRNIANGGTATSPTFFAASNGEVVVGADTVTNVQHFVRLLPGDPNPQVLRTSTSGLYWHEPGVGTLINSNVNNRGNGLYLWTPQNDTRPLLLIGSVLDGSPVTEIQSAVANSRGVIYAMVATASNPMMIVRLQPDTQVVLRSEDRVAVSVPPVISTIMKGRNQGPPTFLVGGLGGSIARLDAAGSLQPIISIGDPIPPGRIFRGSSIGAIRTLSTGGIVFADSNGMYQWEDGIITLLLPNPMTVGGVQITNVTVLEVNSRGDVAVQVNGAGTGLYLVSNGTVTKIFRVGESIAGDVVTSVRVPAIDDTGRVAFYATTAKGEALAFWQQGAISIILTDGMAVPGGRTTRFHDGNTLASADAFYLSVTLNDGTRTHMRYQSTAWEFVVTPTERMPNGSYVTFGGGTYTVNRPGDVIFQYNGGSYINHLVAKRGGSFQQIQDWGELTQNGDLLQGLTSLLLLDDGTAYALATTDSGQQVVYRATPITGTSEVSFTARSNGGVSIRSSGAPVNFTVGYSSMDSVSMLSGMAIFGYRQNGVLVSEAAVPASLPLLNGRIYAEVSGPVNTGLAIANPNAETARISYYFTRSDGTDFGSGVLNLDAGKQTAAFLDQSPFNSGSFSGTFTFSSSVPVGVVALRGYSNTRGEFLITTLPVTNISQAPQTAATTLPHFATGGGWTTQILLVNPTSSAITGSIQFYSTGSDTASGVPVAVTSNGQTNSSFAYSIPPKASFRLAIASGGTAVTSGSVRVMPAAGQTAPSSLAVFSFTSGNTVVSEAGVTGLSGTSMLMYAEASGVPFTVGSIQSGVAITNPSNQPTTVILELRRLDGSSAGVAPITFTIQPNAQVSRFLNQFFPNLPTPFQGVLKVTAGSPVSVAGLRGRTNERNDFLITTTNPSPIGSATLSSNLIFPHLVDGGGYTTQIVIIGNGAGDFPGTLQFFSQSGQPLPLTLN